MTYLRCTIGRWNIDLNSDEGQETFRSINDVGLRVFRSQPGFIGYRLMVAEPTTTIAVAEWESEEFCQGGRRPSGLRSTPTANFPEGAAALVSTRSPGVCGDRRTTRLSGYLGQRPPDLSPPVARWTDGTGRGTGQYGTDGSSDHGGAPDRARAGGAGQELGRHRSPLRWSARRRGGAWFFCPGLRRDRHPLRGALEASRGGGVGDARFVAQGGLAVQGRVLLNGRRRAGTLPHTTAWPSYLDR